MVFQSQRCEDAKPDLAENSPGLARNFGDAKAIKGTKGLFEMREHRGPGFRLFYGLEGKRVVLLLVGSAKKDQAAAIAKATRYLADYRERKKK